MRDWAFQAMHAAAMALPPSDFGSHRAVEAAAELLRKERATSDELLDALKYLVMHCKRLDRFEGNPINEAIRAGREAVAKAEGR